ncbi:hypothetical protein [Chitinophaga sp.]|uniref:hypothetical protein n=1 Tax=Chitinophaga sp. TaxID=1869181 RepID=UPI0031D3F937
MYPYLLVAHSVFRWLVVVFIVYTICRCCVGLMQHRPFSKTDDAFRHWTATVAHIQLMIGMVLYAKSPLVQYFWSGSRTAPAPLNISFFAVIHILLMFAAIVLLTAGSALAKRKLEDREKFRTILIWYAIVLVVIVIAIPWPFSPLSARPYLRMF